MVFLFLSTRGLGDGPAVALKTAPDISPGRGHRKGTGSGSINVRAPPATGLKRVMRDNAWIRLRFIDGVVRFFFGRLPQLKDVFTLLRWGEGEEQRWLKWLDTERQQLKWQDIWYARIWNEKYLAEFGTVIHHTYP